MEDLLELIFVEMCGMRIFWYVFSLQVIVNKVI